MIVGIKILPKKQTLDVQGRAIAKTLKRRGYPIKNCSLGKFIKLEIKANNKKQALDKAQKIAEDILCHSLVEDYELEIIPLTAGREE